MGAPRTSDAGQRQPDRKQFTAQTFAFLHQVNGDRHLMAIDVKIAVALTKYFNLKDGGRAYPSAKTLGADTGMSERSVLRSIDRLAKREHLYVIPGQRGRAHPGQYWMLIKPAQPCLFSEAEKTGKSDTQGNNKTGIRGKKTGIAVPVNLFKNHRGDVRTSPPMRERESLTAFDPAGAGGLDGPAPDGAETKQAAIEEEADLFHGGQDPGTAVPEAIPEDTSEAEIITPADSFAELRKVWVRPWPDHDDREALRSYVMALHDVEPDVILDAARNWVEAADNPRFLPKLSKWLADRAWERDPPQKRGKGPGYRKGRKPDLADIAFEYGREHDDDDCGGSPMWGAGS